jgi:hypothetical protein
MERGGVPRRIAMAITGHLTESMYRRYDIVNGQDTKKAGRKMEHFFEQARVQQPAPKNKPEARVQ